MLSAIESIGLAEIEVTLTHASDPLEPKSDPMHTNGTSLSLTGSIFLHLCKKKYSRQSGTIQSKNVLSQTICVSGEFAWNSHWEALLFRSKTQAEISCGYDVCLERSGDCVCGRRAIPWILLCAYSVRDELCETKDG